MKLLTKNFVLPCDQCELVVLIDTQVATSSKMTDSHWVVPVDEAPRPLCPG